MGIKLIKNCCRELERFQWIEQQVILLELFLLKCLTEFYVKWQDYRSVINEVLLSLVDVACHWLRWCNYCKCNAFQKASEIKISNSSAIHAEKLTTEISTKTDLENVILTMIKFGQHSIGYSHLYRYIWDVISRKKRSVWSHIKTPQNIGGSMGMQGAAAPVDRRITLLSQKTLLFCLVK